MKKSIKKLWVEALRSGKFKKGKQRLHPTKNTWCCLGVLCELHRTRLKKPKEEWKNNGIDNEYLGESALLPYEVQKWAGLSDSNPDCGSKNLAEWNDRTNKSFKQIADLIEEHL